MRCSNQRDYINLSYEYCFDLYIVHDFVALGGPPKPPFEYASVRTDDVKPSNMSNACPAIAGRAFTNETGTRQMSETESECFCFRDSRESRYRDSHSPLPAVECAIQPPPVLLLDPIAPAALCSPVCSAAFMLCCSVVRRCGEMLLGWITCTPAPALRYESEDAGERETDDGRNTCARSLFGDVLCSVA